MDKDLTLRITQKKIKKPGLLYNVLGWVWKTFVAPKYNVHYNIKCDADFKKEQFIFISNHASRADYIFTGVPVLPSRMNFVAGYNEFFRSHLAGVFNLLKVIPKKNFTPDAYALREISRIIKNGGNIMIFPEGMSSISGANQPVAIGTGKFIKHFKLPVYYSVIKGGYLTSPKYNLKDRFGRVDVEIDRLFTPDDLETLTPDEIEDKINAAIYHDDYAWNKKMRYSYDIGDSGAENLENLLFWCPKCGSFHTMKGVGNEFKCLNCGNGGVLQNTYDIVPFDDGCVIPETQTEWFNMQREIMKKRVTENGFVLTEKVKLGMIPKTKMLKDKKTSEIVGEGVITLDRNGFTYDGTKNGENFSFHIDSNGLPTYGMCTDLSRFYTFYQGEFVEFYPENNVVEEFFLATEEIHRLNGGKWQDFKFEK